MGVIGGGSVSGSYLPVMGASPYIKLVSACDLIIQRAEGRAKSFNIPRVYPNDEMLKGPKFDSLVNLTSMPSHYPVNLKGGAGWLERRVQTEVAGKKVWTNGGVLYK